MTSDIQKTTSNPSAPLGFEQHDHAHCIETVLQAVERRCAEEGLRLTPVRLKVLEILLQEHRALGAYAILDRLREAGFGSQPPVAYRALDFLVEHGFVHKVQRLNAFVACAHPDSGHSPVFMICKKCDSVVEAESVPASKALGVAARAAGFHVERTTVEAEGVCPLCVDNSAP